MPGDVNDILPQPVDAATAAAIEELVARKMKVAATLAVQLLRAMEVRYGPPARAVIGDVVASYRREPRPEAADPGADLHDFCGRLDRNCAGTHRWERVAEEPARIAYRYTRCLWATIFRELGEPELGAALCASDEPAVQSFNPALAFRRTHVLMEGDDYCDHEFYVASPSGGTV